MKETVYVEVRKSINANANWMLLRDDDDDDDDDELFSWYGWLTKDV